MSTYGVMKRWRKEREARYSRRTERKAVGGERGCYLRACRGPPCITSLRCFSTDDIAGLGGGGLALGMMSLITNQRTRRPIESGQFLGLIEQDL